MASVLDKFHRTRLSQLERMLIEGNSIAEAAAWKYCTEHNIAPPQWLVQHAAQSSLLSVHGTAKKLGRANGIRNRYVEDYKHYARWDLVREIREQQQKAPERLRTFRSNARVLPRGVAALHFHEWLVPWLGSSFDHAFDCASLMLEQSPAFGGPATIKASYLRVEKHMRIPGEAHRYYLLDPSFMKAAEIPSISSQLSQLYEESQKTFEVV